MLLTATSGSVLLKSKSWGALQEDSQGLCKAGRSEYPEVIRRDELSHDGPEVLQQNQWQGIHTILLGPVAHGAFPLSHSQNCICYKQTQQTVGFFKGQCIY